MQKFSWKFKGIRALDSSLAEGNVKVSFADIDGGFACYVSAACEQGFDGQESIVIRPNFADTSDFVAIENHSPFWCRPFWGESFSVLPPKVQELFVRTGDKYLCIIPVCDSVFKTLIRGCDGGFEFYMYSNCDGIKECDHQLAFVVMEGKNPLSLAHSCARAVNDVLGGRPGMREDKIMHEIFEYLGWCSWDAMQIRVNHAGLVEKAREFCSKGVPVRYAIIDDMWADVPSLNDVPEDMPYSPMTGVMHRSKLRSFSGDPKRFPSGMAAAISDIRESGIDHVGIWFPTTGYWSGLDENGSEAARQAGNTVVNGQGQIIVAPEKDAAARYFNDLCGRVKAWGADFVKIDNQGFHQRYANIAPIGESARAIHSAIDASTDKYFDGALINCMGMPSECMFNRTSTVSRTSDDFMPENREWFAKHILQCSYGGLLQGQYYVNDWDMWWTDDAQAIKNSVCRAVSGGPIYVSDKIGRTNPEVLLPLCFSDGRIVRCERSAVPTSDCIFENPTLSGRIFKIFNTLKGSAVVAVFNIDAQGQKVVGTLCAEELGINADSCVVYEYFSGMCQKLDRGEKLDIALDNNDEFRLYTVVPCTEGQPVMLGRTDMFVGIGAVESRDGGNVTLREGGKIGFVGDGYAAFDGDTQLEVIENGLLKTVEVDKSVRRIRFEKI